MPSRSPALSLGSCLLVCAVAACFNPTGQTTADATGSSTSTGAATTGDATTGSTGAPPGSTGPAPTTTTTTGPTTTGSTGAVACPLPCDEAPNLYCVDGECLSCMNDPDICGTVPGLPYCDLDGVCKQCSGDPDCADAPGKICDILTKTCVQCFGDSNCIAADPERPLCDKELHVCRGCLEHAECGERACELDTGDCFPQNTEEQPQATLIYYVQPGAANCAINPGLTPNAPLCSIADALKKPLGQTEYLVIHVLSGEQNLPDTLPAEMDSVEFIGKRIAIRGDGAARLVVQTMAPGALRLSGASDVKLFVAGLQVLSANGPAAVRCAGGNLLWLDDVLIQGTDNVAVDPGVALLGENCDVVARRTAIVGNEVGVFVVGQTLTLVDTIVAGSLAPARAAVAVSQIERLDVLYSTIADAKGTTAALLRCDLTKAAVIRNSALVTSPNNGDEVFCDADFLAIDHSLVPTVALARLDMTNRHAADPTAEFAAWPLDLRLGGPAPTFAGVAAWRLGDPFDPKTDIDGQLRPNFDGAPDWAGAALPP